MADTTATQPQGAAIEADKMRTHGMTSDDSDARWIAETATGRYEVSIGGYPSSGDVVEGDAAHDFEFNDNGDVFGGDAWIEIKSLDGKGKNFRFDNFRMSAKANPDELIDFEFPDYNEDIPLIPVAGEEPTAEEESLQVILEHAMDRLAEAAKESVEGEFTNRDGSIDAEAFFEAAETNGKVAPVAASAENDNLVGLDGFYVVERGRFCLNSVYRVVPLPEIAEGHRENIIIDARECGRETYNDHPGLDLQALLREADLDGEYFWSASPGSDLDMRLRSLLDLVEKAIGEE